MKRCGSTRPQKTKMPRRIIISVLSTSADGCNGQALRFVLISFMKFAALKQTLKSTVAPVYLLFGSDIFLLQKSVDLIIQHSGVIAPELDISRLGDSATAEAVIAECRTVSFMGGKRVVVVRPATEAHFTKALDAYLAKPSDTTVLILVSSSEKSPSLKNVETVDCNPMPADLIVKLVANQLAAAGKSITPDAANLLALMCGNNFARIDNELNKLINYYKESNLLSADDVSAIVTKTEEYQIYELSNAITKRDTALAAKIMSNLQASGVEDYAIFGNLVSAFRRIYYSLTARSSQDAVAAFLKCSPFAVMYARRDNKHLISKIAELYAKALDLEYQIKSGAVSVANALIIVQMSV